MPGSYLLDTNGVIANFRGDAAIRARIEAADEIFMAAAVLGELYFGAEKSRRGRENLARVEAFLKLCPVLPAGAEVARRWGQLRQAQKRKGRPIPDNDVWIAATASVYDLIVLSRDRHFSELDGIEVLSW